MCLMLQRDEVTANDNLPGMEHICNSKAPHDGDDDAKSRYCDSYWKLVDAKYRVSVNGTVSCCRICLKVKDITLISRSSARPAAKLGRSTLKITLRRARPRWVRSHAGRSLVTATAPPRRGADRRKTLRKLILILKPRLPALLTRPKLQVNPEPAEALQFKSTSPSQCSHHTKHQSA